MEKIKDKQYHINKFIDIFKKSKLKMDFSPCVVHAGSYWLYSWGFFYKKIKFEITNEEYLNLIDISWQKKKTTEA